MDMGTGQDKIVVVVATFVRVSSGCCSCDLAVVGAQNPGYLPRICVACQPISQA